MKIGIVGYGNVGRGVERAVALNPDVELFAVYTRRDPAEVPIATPGVPVLPVSALGSRVGGPDVLILCGGSATDLPEMTPKYAARYCVVDSFDTHAHIPAHFAAVDAAAKRGKTTALISCGWDPGLFSLARTYLLAALPDGETYTFWGRGVSQGHSDAIRRIPGVADARQYTVPVESALEAVRAGKNPTLTTREKHTRECFVVAKEGADREAITKAIVTMPNYFDEYDTTVTFITQEEMDRDHAAMPHAGHVIRTGHTDGAATETAVNEFSLRLDSNPGFTGGVLIACARAAWKLHNRGVVGALTLPEVAPADLLPLTRDELLHKIL